MPINDFIFIEVKTCVLIDEIHNHAELETARIQRIVGRVEVVVAAKNALVDMAVHHKEASLFHAEVGIGVHEGEIAALHLILVVESHRGRVVGWCVITGIVVAIDAKLAMEHPGYGELDIDVAVDRELGQGQHLGVARRLEGEVIFPMQRFESEVLLKGCIEHMNGRPTLCRSAVAAEVDVVFQRLIAHIDIAARERNIEHTAQAQAGDLVEVVVPSKVIGHKVLKQIGRLFVLEISVSLDSDGVLEQPETGGHVARDIDVAHMRAGNAKLGSGTVGENAAVLLGKLAAYGEVALGVLVRAGHGERVGRGPGSHPACHAVGNLGVTPQLVGGIDGKAKLGVLVEALKHRDAHRVAQLGVELILTGAAVAQIGVVEIGCVLRGRGIDKLVLVVLVVECPYKAGDRHIGLALDGVGHRVALVAVETHLVAVVHVKLGAIEVVLCLGEPCGYIFGIDLALTALHLCRVDDIEVVGDAARLLVGTAVTVYEGLHLVAVAYIGPKSAPPEIFCGLVIVGSLAVDVVDSAAHLDALVDIAAEEHLGSVLVAILVAASGVSQHGHGNARVEKSLGSHRGEPSGQAVLKEEVARGRTIEKYHVLPLGAVISCGRPGLAAQRGDESQPVVFIGGVDSGRIPQAQRVAYRPRIARGYRLLFLGKRAQGHTQRQGEKQVFGSGNSHIIISYIYIIIYRQERKKKNCDTFARKISENIAIYILTDNI